MAAIDLGFVLAVVAFGWGLSLATYRAVRQAVRLAMGSWQQRPSGLPIIVGVLTHPAGARFFAWRAAMAGTC